MTCVTCFLPSAFCQTLHLSVPVHMWQPSVVVTGVEQKLTVMLLQSGMRWLESTYQQKARAWVVRLAPPSPSTVV